MLIPVVDLRVTGVGEGVDWLFIHHLRGWRYCSRHSAAALGQKPQKASQGVRICGSHSGKCGGSGGWSSALLRWGRCRTFSQQGATKTSQGRVLQLSSTSAVVFQLSSTSAAEPSARGLCSVSGWAVCGCGSHLCAEQVFSAGAPETSKLTGDQRAPKQSGRHHPPPLVSHSPHPMLLRVPSIPRLFPPSPLQGLQTLTWGLRVEDKGQGFAVTSGSRNWGWRPGRLFLERVTQEGQAALWQALFFLESRLRPRTHQFHGFSFQIFVHSRATSISWCIWLFREAGEGREEGEQCT